MAEILELTVKSNINSATKDMDNLSKSVGKAALSLDELNAIVKDLETELARLKGLEDAMPTGQWQSAQYNEYVALSASIKKTTDKLNTHKAALKQIEKEQKALTKTTSTHTKAQKKNTNAAIRGIQHFRIMGVSIRKLKFMVRGVIPMFKLLFGTIKSGIASTGIGVLILALISIGTAMKKSVAGGKAFKAMMSGIGVITGAIVSSLTFLGDKMLSVFGFDSSTSAAVTAAENLEKAYKNLGKQISDINTREAQSGVQKLKNQQIIDDTTKSEEERMAALRQGYSDEKKSNNERLAALEKINIADQKAQGLLLMKIFNTEKGSDEVKKLREEEEKASKAESKSAIDLANLKTKMAQADIDIDNDVAKVKQHNIDKQNEANKEFAKNRKKANAKTASEAEKLSAKNLAILKAEQDAKLKLKQELDDIETDIINNQIISAAELLDEFNNSKLEAIDIEKNAVYDKYFAIIEAEEQYSATRIELEKNLASEIAAIETKGAEASKKISDAETKVKEDNINEQLSAFGNLAGALSSLAGDNKELAVASAVIDTYVGANKAFAQGGVVGYVGAAAIIASGLANVQKILSTDVPGGAGAGGGVSSSAEPPAPQMMSGAFDLSGGEAPEALRAYVVTDEMTNSQNQLANIRRRATI